MAYPKMITKYAQTYWNLSRCADRRKNNVVKYIVVHYTGTTAPAKNNCQYFGGGNRNASADFFIDTNGTIYKFNGNLGTRYSWHCGDGYGKYGITNYNSIGIEVVSAGSQYTAKQQEALRKLVRALMADFNVPASRVRRHYDASRKICPKPYCGSTTKNKRWNTLHDLITTESKAANKKTTTKKTTTVKVDAAQSFSKSFAHVYKVTAKDGLNIRNGAGGKTVIKVVPYNSQVSCYGYYTTYKKVKWYFVEYLSGGKSYVGFVSSKYLKKVK